MDEILDNMDARRKAIQNQQFTWNARRRHWKLEEEEALIVKTHTDIQAAGGEDAELEEGWSK